MKKIFTLFLLLSFNICQGQTIDSVVVSNCRWFVVPDSGTSVTIDSFDVNHLLINSNSHFVNSDSTWISDTRELNTYSNFNQLLNQLKQEWKDTAWITNDEIINQYDSNDSLIEHFKYHYYYNSGILSSTFGRRYTYSRDTINHTISTIYRQYIDSTSVWDTSCMFLEKYDALQRLTLKLWFFPNSSGQLTVTDSIEYFYLPNDSIDYIIEKHSSSYTSLKSDLYNYNSNGFLFNIAHNAWNYQTMMWVVKSFDQNYYDINNNITAQTWHMYIDSMIDWCGDSTAYQYDSFNKQIYYWSQTCGGGGGEGYSLYDSLEILSHSHFCKWGHASGVECRDCDYTYLTAPFYSGILEIGRTDFQLYPNPAQNHFTIKLSNDLKSAQLEIFNVLGEQMFSQPVINEQTIGFSLQNGIYFVRVSNGEKSVVRKVVIE